MSRGSQKFERKLLFIGLRGCRGAAPAPPSVIEHPKILEFTPLNNNLPTSKNLQLPLAFPHIIYYNTNMMYNSALFG